MDCSLPGSFVHGISQARVLEWVALLGIKTESPASQCRFLTPGPPAKSWHGAFFFFLVAVGFCCSKWGLLFIVVRRLLIEMASLVEHGH